MPSSPLTRRRFLGEAGCAALSSTSILSTLLNLQLANKAAAQELPASEDRKTLVCLFLHGGIDSFNLLIPRDDRYQEYLSSRTNLAIAQGDLLSLQQATGGDGKLYGLHPATAGYQDLFNGLGGDEAKRRLSFISNIGTLVQPTSMADYHNGTAPLPRALFSHIDQIEQWQTSVPQGMTELTGWAGRAADVLHDTYNEDLLSMSLSFAGNNPFQVGDSTQQFVMTANGALTFSERGGDANHVTQVKNEAFKSLINRHYHNLMEEAYASLTKNSIEQQAFVQQVFDSVSDDFVSTTFPSTSFGSQLRSALKMIHLRESLGLRRQTIFLSYGGWDHHSELLNTQAGMLEQLAPAILAFQNGIEELGLEDSVLTFSASDFGRTLRSNGNGTDHAWGGNQMVFGGPVDGGRIHGTYPSLALDGADDVGYGGRLLPTTSVDEFFAELLLWFGVKGRSNFEHVLPNLSSFYDVAQANPLDPTTLPLGFLKPGTFES
ncbi:MAG: DUF1501 domain-containing protein [Verrucomicrobiota bacterium JB023]|nr:DUF1501 domain-containing protein [Verrucomicrobiota bacterium JB023]